LPLKLNVALLCDRRLLDGNHLPLHLGQLGCGLLVAANEERRRPEDDDRGGGCHAVFGALTVLCTGQRRCPGRNGLSFERQLLASVALIGNRRDIAGVISAELDAQPPSAAPSTTIPRIRILLIPRPASIQAQPGGEGKGESAKAPRKGWIFKQIRRLEIACQSLGPNAFRTISCSLGPNQLSRHFVYFGAPEIVKFFARGTENRRTDDNSYEGTLAIEDISVHRKVLFCLSLQPHLDQARLTLTVEPSEQLSEALAAPKSD